jgi:hypothetical protein
VALVVRNGWAPSMCSELNAKAETMTEEEAKAAIANLEEECSGRLCLWKQTY